MTTEAILFIIFGWGFAFGLLGYCIVKVIASNNNPGDTPPE